MSKGLFLRRWRVDKGYNRAQVARMIQVHSETLHNWERNLSSPRSGSLKKLVGVYGFNLDDYLECYRNDLISGVDRKLGTLKRRCS